MLLLRSDSLPNSQQWLYELKLDGYRAIAFKRGGIVHLRSRNDNDFSARYPGVVKGLANMPDNTVIDGEVVAFDEVATALLDYLREGRPQLAVRVYRRGFQTDPRQYREIFLRCRTPAGVLKPTAITEAFQAWSRRSGGPGDRQSS